MKRLVIIIALMLMANTSWAFDLDVPLYSDPSSGGAGAQGIANVSDWTLAGGLEVDSAYIQLRVGGASTWNSNSLDMTTLPGGNWTSSGTEVATVIDSTLLEILDDNGATFRIFRLPDPSWTADLSSGSNGVSAAISMHPSGTNTTKGAIRVEFDDGNARWQYEWLENGGVLSHVYVGASNSADIGKYVYSSGVYYFAIQDASADVWAFNDLTNIFDALIVNEGAAATAIDALGFGSGSSTATGKSYWDYLNYAQAFQSTPFLTTSPTATMGQITVGCEITNIPITVTVGGAATVTWDYDIGAGWVTGKTFAQLETALVGTSPSTLNLRSNHNSAGQAQAKFMLDGSGLCD